MTLPTMAPWAEEDRNGVLTGDLANEPPHTASGEVVPNWRYIGDMSVNDFAAQFMLERHNNYHLPRRADWRCRHCREVGWIK